MLFMLMLFMPHVVHAPVVHASLFSCLMLFMLMLFMPHVVHASCCSCSYFFCKMLIMMVMPCHAHVHFDVVHDHVHVLAICFSCCSCFVGVVYSCLLLMFCSCSWYLMVMMVQMTPIITMIGTDIVCFCFCYSIDQDSADSKLEPLRLSSKPQLILTVKPHIF